MESCRMFLVVLYLLAHSHRHEKKYESRERSCALICSFTSNRSDQCVNHFQSISRISSLLLIILLFRCAICTQRSQRNNAYSYEIDKKSGQRHQQSTQWKLTGYLGAITSKIQLFYGLDGGNSSALCILYCNKMVSGRKRSLWMTFARQNSVYSSDAWLAADL